MEPLSIYLLSRVKQYLNFNKNIAFDECIARFCGLAYDSLTISNKSILTGFKSGALGQ